MRASTRNADLRHPRCNACSTIRSRAGIFRPQPRRRHAAGRGDFGGGAMILPLAIKSLRNRRFTAGLTVLSIALSVALLLGVERIRQESRETFASSVSGTDLIVGARSSPVHLLLSSVFRIGNATNSVSWKSYRRIADLPEVAWTIPLSLGDSHRGFTVLGP